MKMYLSLIAAVCLVFSAFTAPAKAVVNFDDVPMTHGFAYEIVFLHAEGIIDGYPDGTFRPDDPVTRGHAAAMIGRALQLDDAKRRTDFSDVPASHRFSGYIQSAKESGIINGYPDGTFRPNQQVTRGHVALMLAQAFDFPEVYDESFSDVGPNMNAYEAIAVLANFGVAKGYGDGTFRPNQLVTRGQFAAFLARAFEPTFLPDKAQLLETANEILSYLQDENFTAVASYTSSAEGLTFCPYAGGCLDDGGVTMTPNQVRNFMSDSMRYLWGHEAGSGFEIRLRPAQYYDDYLLNAPFEEKERYGQPGHPMSRDLVREHFPEATIVEFYYPGTEEYEGLDWQSLNMVFEKNSSGDWVLIGLVNDRWTP